MSKAGGVLRSARAAAAGGKLSLSMKSFLFGGAALFGSTTYFTYRYAKAHTELREEDGAVDVSDSFRVFDRIALKYDDAVGQEEAALWYGMMRRSLLSEARGDVLEVSVGTGRNFKHYPLDQNNIRSFTFTDLSEHMLLRAEDKWFDELQLGHKHPNVRTTFCLADAHCLLDPNAPPPTPPKPKPKPKPPAARVMSVPVPAAGPDDGYSPPWWAYWRRLPPANSTESPAEAAAAAQQPGGDKTSVPSGTGGDPIADDDAETKEMPGLHSRGLLNFFRVFAPSSGDTSTSAPVNSGSGSAEPSKTASEAVPPPAEKPSASGPAPDAKEKCHACCSAHGGKTCKYQERCTSGKLASGAVLQKFAPQQFDTVVDTFGLCSHEDPVQALREMARVCKRNGKILLLQHGKSDYSWLNNKLDESATDHQQKWGCLWNRDMLEIVNEAGLQVDKVTRWHFGTSYFIIARPPADR